MNALPLQMGEQVDGRFIVDGREVHCGDVLQLLTMERPVEWLTFRAEFDHGDHGDRGWFALVDIPGGGRITFPMRSFHVVRWVPRNYAGAQ